MKRLIFLPFIIYGATSITNTPDKSNASKTFLISTDSAKILNSLKEGFYQQTTKKDLSSEEINSATVKKTNNKLEIAFKMYWSSEVVYDIFYINGPILKAKHLIDTNEYDSLTIRILSDNSFKVIDGTYNWIADFPYLYNVEYRRKYIKSPETLFAEWEINLQKKGIFDYVTKKDCDNLEKMMNLYDQGKYPMHTESKTILPFDFNNDNIKDYLVNYNLTNCVNGNDWASDFIFMTSENGNLAVNEPLTNRLKKWFWNYVVNNFGSDDYLTIDHGFIKINSFEIDSIVDNICYGDFALMQNGVRCCPQKSGKFLYNITENTFSVFDLKDNE